jgi:uncharacterized damage-inducible protein DinB
MKRDLRGHLLFQLNNQRDALLAKLDGLSEREVRLPRTPTGTNLLGIVKHCLNVEHGYFGPTFGAVMPEPAGLLELSDYDDDPQVDWYATEDETLAGVIALYGRVRAFVDAQITALDLDSPGIVPWWGEDHRDVTLGQIGLHVLEDLARHAGQADIIREQIDGAVGFWGAGDNLPDGYDWPAYVARLTAIADRF